MNINHDRRSSDPDRTVVDHYNRIGKTIYAALAADEYTTSESIEALQLIYGPLQVELGPIQLAPHDANERIFVSTMHQLGDKDITDRRSVYRLSLQGFLRLAEDVVKGNSQISIEPDGRRVEQRCHSFFPELQRLESDYYAAIKQANINEQQLNIIERARATLAWTRGDIVLIRQTDWDLAEIFHEFRRAADSSGPAHSNSVEQIADCFIQLITAGFEIPLPHQTAGVIRRACLEGFVA